MEVTALDFTLQPAAVFDPSGFPESGSARKRFSALKPLPAASPKGPQSPDPDAPLVARAQAGDVRAFEALVIKHQRGVIAKCARIVGDADAEDVAQQVFVRVHRGLKNFQRQSKFSTWLFCIAVNQARNHLDARHCRPVLQDVDVADAELFGHTEQLSDRGTPEAYLLADELEAKLLAAIRNMPESLRKTICLREIDGLDYSDIAKVLRIPVGTVRSRIFRARELIDEKLKPLLA